MIFFSNVFDGLPDENNRVLLGQFTIPSDRWLWGSIELLAIFDPDLNPAHEFDLEWSIPLVVNGACCFVDGSCDQLEESECKQQQGAFHGIGVSCARAACQPQIGACCFDDGSCEELLEVECDAQTGAFQGVGVTCKAAACAANCAGHCGNTAPAGCSCDISCCTFQDCCDSFYEKCGGCKLDLECLAGIEPGWFEEPEECGEAVNNSPATATPIACGETVCGTTWLELDPETADILRDFDFYAFDITDDVVDVTICHVAGFQRHVALVDMNNPGPPIMTQFAIPLVEACETVTLASGTYAVGIWAIQTVSVPEIYCWDLSNTYTLSITCASPPEVTASIAVRSGDPLPGDGLAGASGVISNVNGVSVNDNGDWIVDVSVTGGSISSALIKNGQVWLKAGDPIPPDDEVLSVANPLDALNNHGDVAHRPSLVNNSSGMYLNFTPLMLQGAMSASPAFAPGAEYIGFFRGRVTDDQQVAMIATVDNAAQGFLRAIVWLGEDGQGGVSEDVVVKQFDPAPGTGAFIDFIRSNSHSFATSNSGSILWQATLTGSPPDENGALYRDLDLLVRKGDPSPVDGAQYNDVGGTGFRVDMNDSGDYVFKSSLQGHAPGANVLVKDVGDGHEVVALRGEVAPGLDGVRTIESLGAVVQPYISNDGDVFWYARFDGDADTNQGLYRNNQLILQKGVTEVEGNLITTVCGTTPIHNGSGGSMSVSDDGSRAIVQVQFEDGTRAALLLTIGDVPEPTPCPGDINSDGVVNGFDLVDLLSCWGPVTSGCEAADLNGDDVVNGFDLVDLLSAWGPCP